MKTTGGLSILLLAGILLGGCAEKVDLYPFYEWDSDTEPDAGQDTDSETETETESATESDTDPCDDDYIDEEERCIRYVDWDSGAGICGQGWEDAFTRLQDGIDSAWTAAQILGYCEVWVADGTYRSYEGDPGDTIRLRGDVAVFGGFVGNETELESRDVVANETIIDGRAQDGSGASYHVVTGMGTSTLDGFTITGGKADGDPPNHRGGGIYTGSVAVTVRNCTVAENLATLGGGVFAWDSSPAIVDTVIRNNSATMGGGLYILNGTATVDSVVVTENTAAEDGGGVYLDESLGTCQPSLHGLTVTGNTAGGGGGGVYNHGCAPSFAGSVVSYNAAGLDGGGLAGFRGSTYAAGTYFIWNTAGGDGGGVASYDNEVVLEAVHILWNEAGGDGGGLDLLWADGNLEACLIAGNYADGSGGGLHVEMDFTRLEETLIDGNRAYRGAGIYSGMRGDPELVNMVVAGNAAADMGGALYNAELSGVSVVNSILWGNGASPIVDEPGSSTTVAHSDVEGGYPGTCNLDADPLFMDPGYYDDMGTTYDTSDDTWVLGDYHLSEGSPCVDTADDLSTPTTDMEGLPWEDVADAGLPGVLGDMGPYDLKP